MINSINSIIEDKFDAIRSKTLYDIVRLYLLIATISYILGRFFSVYSLENNLRLITLFIVIVSITTTIIMYSWKKIKSDKIRLGVFFAVNLFYTLFATLTSPGKYLTTNGISVVILTAVIYTSLSVRYLIIQGVITLSFIIIFGISGIGKSVDIGAGYVIGNSGMYLLMIYTFLKGIKMFNQFKQINTEQLIELNNKNDELNALNEEYIATDEILRHNLEYDSLTGLLNRSGFHSFVEPLFSNKQEKPFYIFMFDIDNFMFINNAFGFLIGDKVLIQLANSLSVSSKDLEFLCRGEGDSFMFITRKSLGVEKILHIIEDSFHSVYVDGVKLRIKASIGIAESDECSSSTELMRNAEAAMRQVKLNGKGASILYSNRFVKKMEEQYTLFNAIDDAVVNNEFYNVYQPKIDIMTRRVIGFEALVRWESPTLGAVYPDKFIPISEYTGQIIEIGYIVLKNAMEFAKKISLMNEKLIVSINISPKQLLEPNFVDQVFQIMKRMDLEPNNIAFEVTETAYVEKLIEVNKVLNELNKLGIVIYLDDFGTGYSSLNYLNQLPIHVLKIDKSFIDKIHLEGAAENLVKTILIMAKSLNLKCIAEGVEVVEQLQVLEKHECDIIQGYIFDKPLREEEAISRIHKIYS